MKEITLHFTKINNVTTSVNLLLPNNLDFLLDNVKQILKDHPIYLYCRFEFQNSNYQVNNKNFIEYSLK